MNVNENVPKEETPPAPPEPEPRAPGLMTGPESVWILRHPAKGTAAPVLDPTRRRPRALEIKLNLHLDIDEDGKRETELRVSPIDRPRAPKVRIRPYTSAPKVELKVAAPEKEYTCPNGHKMRTQKGAMQEVINKTGMMFHTCHVCGCKIADADGPKPREEFYRCDECEYDLC